MVERCLYTGGEGGHAQKLSHSLTAHAQLGGDFGWAASLLDISKMTCSYVWVTSIVNTLASRHRVTFKEGTTVNKQPTDSNGHDVGKSLC